MGSLEQLIMLDNMDPSEHPLLKGQTIEEQIRTLVNANYTEPVTDENYQVWLTTKNDYFQGDSPQDFIDRGEGRIIRSILWRMAIGMPD